MPSGLSGRKNGPHLACMLLRVCDFLGLHSGSYFLTYAFPKSMFVGSKCVKGATQQWAGGDTWLSIPASPPRVRTAVALIKCGMLPGNLGAGGGFPTYCTKRTNQLLADHSGWSKRWTSLRKLTFLIVFHAPSCILAFAILSVLICLITER